MTKNTLRLRHSFASALLLLACGGSPAAPATNAEPRVSFAAEVHPILVAQCGDCHGEDTPGIPGHGASDPDIAFAATQAMLMGQPVYERILARASGADPDGFMPPAFVGCEGPLGAPSCLTVAQFETIELWVEQGASER